MPNGRYLNLLHQLILLSTTRTYSQKHIQYIQIMCSYRVGGSVYNAECYIYRPCVYVCLWIPPPPQSFAFMFRLLLLILLLLYVHRGNGAIYLQMCICYSNCVKAHKVWAEVIYTLVQLYTLSVWEVPRGLEVKDILFAEGPGNNDAAAAQSHSRGSCSTQPSLS